MVGSAVLPIKPSASSTLPPSSTFMIPFPLPRPPAPPTVKLPSMCQRELLPGNPCRADVRRIPLADKSEAALDEAASSDGERTAAEPTNNQRSTAQAGVGAINQYAATTGTIAEGATA